MFSQETLSFFGRCHLEKNTPHKEKHTVWRPKRTSNCNPMSPRGWEVNSLYAQHARQLEDKVPLREILCILKFESLAIQWFNPEQRAKEPEIYSKRRQSDKIKTEWTTLIHQKTEASESRMNKRKEMNRNPILLFPYFPIWSKFSLPSFAFFHFIPFALYSFLSCFHHPIKFSWVIEQNIPYIIGFHLSSDSYYATYAIPSYTVYPATLVLPIYMGREKHKTFKRITKVKISFPCFRTLLSLHIAGWLLACLLAVVVWMKVWSSSIV